MTKSVTDKHPKPWRAWSGPLRPGMSGTIVEVIDADGETVIPWSGFDHLKKTPAIALARRIAQGVNNSI